MSKTTKAAALAYRSGRDSAPKVIAAGKGRIAEKILTTARAAGVPIREDPGLAEILSRLDPGEEIPPETYRAVAEILAFLYRVDLDVKSPRSEAGALKAASGSPSPRDGADTPDGPDPGVIPGRLR